MDKVQEILIYGYGNPGRQDDGLGIFLSEKINHWIKEENIQSVKVDCNYQLNIEDALEIADKNLVIFIDASKEEINDYYLTKVEPSDRLEFTTHTVSPAYLLNLCKVVYNKTPDMYLLHIKGYKWEFFEEMTKDAKKNLRKAYDFLKEFIINNKNPVNNTS
jgi:hydrogenase maturation protease